MTRDEAVRRASEALAAWEQNVHSPSRFTENMAGAMRDLLAVEVDVSVLEGNRQFLLDILRRSAVESQPSEAVKRCREAARAWRDAWGRSGATKESWEMSNAIDALPDTLAPVLTEKEVTTVAYMRRRYEGGYLWDAETMEKTLAIIDRLCPPEPKHKDCAHCGGPPARWVVTGGSYPVEIRCRGYCGAVVGGQTEAEAWERWDRRTP
jgi:hypothetical protein